MRAGIVRVVAAPRSARAKRWAYRKVFLRLPVREGAVFFESARGAAATGSPRAVHEALRAADARADVTWSHTGDTSGFPADARLVHRHSWAYYWRLARAAYWLDDLGFPASLRKRPATTYVLTPAAPPLDFTGFDRPETKMDSREALKRLERTLRRIDLLTVSSDHEAQILKSALRLKNDPLPTGQPRHDPLTTPPTPESRTALRTRLSLPPTHKIVLHHPAPPALTSPTSTSAAPTLAGSTPATSASVALLSDTRGADVLSAARAAAAVEDRAVPVGAAALARELGEGFVVLGPEEVAGRADRVELLAAADVVVGEWGPVMWEAALLDRPIVIDGAGLAERVRRRGSYLDVERDAPGPVVEGVAA
ncbi:CDP-glycerol glycerophosphotransferase family protein, partial [Actinocorallia lasiicapitis]